MDVFITGGTGVIGRPLTKRLIAEGASVTGLARTDPSARQLEDVGAHVVRGDINQPDEWIKDAAKADVLIRATSIAFGRRPGRSWLKAGVETTRIETEALVEAAKTDTPSRALLYTSGWIVVGDHGETWVDENAPQSPLAFAEIHRTGERIISQARADGVPTFALRPGIIYESAGNFADVFLAEAEKGRFKYMGDGQNFMPFVAIEDVVDAFARSVEHPPNDHAINIVDDEPIRMREFVELLMPLFDKKPGGVPLWLAKRLAGPILAGAFAASIRARNDRAKASLGWTPQHPRLRDRLADVVANYKEDQRDHG